MADFTFVDGNAPTATNWNTNVRDQLVVICTSSTRPAAPSTGRAIYETDTNREMRYDGAVWQRVGQIGAWTAYTPTWTAATANPAIGNGTITGRYLRMWGKTGLALISLTAGSTTTFGTGTWSCSLPSGWESASTIPLATAYAADASAGTPYPCLARMTTSTTVQVRSFTVSGSTVIESAISATAPYTWANTDALYAFICIELV